MAGTSETTAESTTARAVKAKPAEEELYEQISRLREDVKALGAALTRLGTEKVGDAEGRARREYRHLVRSGQSVISDVGDEFEQVERQLKDTIRERPLTAVLGALGLGFVIALLTR